MGIVVSKNFALVIATAIISVAAACVFGGPELRAVDISSTEFTDSLGNISLEVKCTILNVGDRGQVTVTVEVDGLGGPWTESENSEMTSGEERLFTFTFLEVVRQRFGSGGYDSSCTAESG